MHTTTTYTGEAIRVAAANVLYSLESVGVHVQQGHDGGYVIPSQAVDSLTDAVQQFAAELIGACISAGSERDSVMENESLRVAIRDEVASWSR